MDVINKPGISDYSVLGNNPIFYIDPNGADWYKNNKTGESKWFKGHGKHKGFTYLGDKNYVFETKGSQLSEVVVTATTRAPKKPMTEEYTKAFNTQMEKRSVRTMIMGLSTVGNRLYGSPYNPYKILELTPEQKQQVFNQDANKSLGILFSEFVEGTGRETRQFDQNAPITQEIANSYTTSLFFDYFYPLYKAGAFGDGQERLKTIFTSPDNAGSMKKSIKAHGQILWNMSAFFTGSLDYYFKVSGNTLQLRVHNEFSISSGVTRNKADDLHRVPGHDSPLGNTQQYFNFSIDLNKLKRN